jgi:hypothetical protein
MTFKQPDIHVFYSESGLPTKAVKLAELLVATQNEIATQRSGMLGRREAACSFRGHRVPVVVADVIQHIGPFVHLTALNR